jgi:hypothetical protein
MLKLNINFFLFVLQPYILQYNHVFHDNNSPTIHFINFHSTKAIIIYLFTLIQWKHNSTCLLRIGNNSEMKKKIVDHISSLLFVWLGIVESIMLMLCVLEQRLFKASLQYFVQNKNRAFDFSIILRSKILLKFY